MKLHYSHILIVILALLVTRVAFTKKLDDVKTSISGSIDKLAKQNAELDRKSEKITLEENIGSLAEVAATFKAQSKQMEHEKKE